MLRPPPPAPPAPPKDVPQGSYSIRSQVSLVVLHASVLNDRSVFVPGLKEENFRVLEDKVEQKLSVFKQEDVPVSFGLVVDNSGSMRDKRPQVNAAALTFVKTSNPRTKDSLSILTTTITLTPNTTSPAIWPECERRSNASTRAAARRFMTP